MRQIAIYFNATDRTHFGGEPRNDVELFREALSPLMPGFDFIAFDPPNGEFPSDLTAFDGVILTGSAAMVGDGDPWIARLLQDIRQLDMAKIRTLGICFGHQAIAKALGGTITTRPLTLGVPHLEILAPQPWMHPYLPSLKLYAGNEQQVTKLPPTATKIAIGRGNPNAMFVKDRHMLGLQFHPEFTTRFMEGYVDHCFSKHSIDAHTHHEARSEISGGTDQDVMMKWISHFFLDSE